MEENEADSVGAWLADHGVALLVIVVGAFLLVRLANPLISRVVRRAIKGDKRSDAAEERQREDTLIHILHGAFQILIYLIAGMMILSELGVDIGPLVAGAGIIGVALGFGGQWLIKDIIAGIFILLENQYRVGDVVDLDGSSGVVEEMTLRATVLRDMDGNVHHVPNGSIERASNMSKSFSGINLDIGVAYDSDLDKVIKIINDTGQQLAQDKDWKDNIIDPPHFLRVQELGDSAVVVKVTGKVKPMKQWATTGELRLRLKQAFDKAKIEIPFPQRVIHQKKS